MALVFNRTMDANSLEVNRLKNRVIDGVLTGSDEEQLGHIMWHQNRSPRFVSMQGFGYLSLEELKEISDRLTEMVRGR